MSLLLQQKMMQKSVLTGVTVHKSQCSHHPLISFPKKVDYRRALLIPKMISLLLFLIPLSSSRLLDELKSPSFLDRDVLDEDQTEMRGSADDIVLDDNDGFPSLQDRTLIPDWLNAKMDVEKSVWTEDQTKMYLRGVEDNSTVVTFSVKVYYTVEVGERAGGRITDMVNVMIDNMNKRFEGALAKVELHCLEEMNWTEKDAVSVLNKGLENYKHADRNSADAVIYVVTDVGMGRAGFGLNGGGLSAGFSSFDSQLRSWMSMDYLTSDYVEHHELGHNLGNDHPGKGYEGYNGRTIMLVKRFRFALAAVGDEQEPCPKQEAAWEFRLS